MDAGILTGPFVNHAAHRGLVPPVRVVGGDGRGWPLITRAEGTMFVDEFGELWWARPSDERSVRLIRPCWPEELVRARADIERALEALTHGVARA